MSVSAAAFGRPCGGDLTTARNNERHAGYIGHCSFTSSAAGTRNFLRDLLRRADRRGLARALVLERGTVSSLCRPCELARARRAARLLPRASARRHRHAGVAARAPLGGDASRGDVPAVVAAARPVS